MDVANITADFELNAPEHFDCSFEIYASGTVWGSIDGDINNQTDLINILNDKADISYVDNTITDLAGTVTDNYNTLSGEISALSTTVNNNYTSLDNRLTTAEQGVLDLTDIINTYGDIVTYNAAYFATANQGALANTALQPGDNITELVNNAGFITSADLPTLADLTTTAQLAAINSGATSTNIAQIATNTQAITTEVTNRQNADNDLQSQIDAIVSSSDVFDIVGTYAELQAYDIATVPVNDIIKVLVDSTHNNAATYYRCIENNNAKSWSYIGAEGAYYTKSESDSRFVAQTITVNGQPLSSNVTLTASDVGALPDSTTIPTATSDLTNDSGFITSSALSGYATESWVGNQGYITGITSSDVTTALGYTPYNSTNPDGYITSSALTNYVTTNTAQDISGRKTFLGEKAIYFKQNATTDKLGFTLFNPSGTELSALEYRPNTISGSALLALNTSYANSCYVGFRYWGTAVNIVAPKVSTSGDYYIPTHITNGNTTVTASNNGTINISTLLPTIPTVGNGTITINQGGTQKGTFTVNQSGDTTINLDAGGGGGGAVDSVNGYTGVVVLTATDVGALPDSTVIPTVNNATITFTQGGTTKGTITLNQSTNQTIALDAGGSGGGGTWGSITGTLSDQTDLQNALNAKLNVSDVTEYTAAEVETLWGSI